MQKRSPWTCWLVVLANAIQALCVVLARAVSYATDGLRFLSSSVHRSRRTRRGDGIGSRALRRAPRWHALVEIASADRGRVGSPITTDSPSSSAAISLTPKRPRGRALVEIAAPDRGGGGGALLAQVRASVARRVFAPSDYHFDLPPELIAQEPAAERDASRLLHVGADGTLADHRFPDIVELLPRDAVLVVNDTRVIAARVLGHKPSGGRVELLFLEPEAVAAPPGTVAWRCLARARRPLHTGQRVNVDGTEVSLELLSDRQGDEGSVVIAVPGDPYALLERVGHVPLPRYVHRPDAALDRDRYQTIFARAAGAVAAPTAGLHMTPAIVEQLAQRGIVLATVTLHVGYGTFEPIRSADIRNHHMHRERYTIPAATSTLLGSGRPVVALGTTALRALEASGGVCGSGTTDLFIYPGSGHTFRVVEHLLTNFHLPESTLLMLVCAFAGTDHVLAAYGHAVARRYRFFSYGDAMLLHRRVEA